MDFLTPYTELEAVNTLLQSIGHSPISAIPVSGLELPNIANNVVKGTSRAVQTPGIWCNTEYNYPLVKQTDGRIKVPYATLEVQLEGSYTLRGQYVYDLANHTDVHEEDLTAEEIIFLLPFDELPNYVREYITVKAGRYFQLTQKPTTVAFNFSKEQEQEAYTMFKSKQDEKTPANLLQAGDVYDIAHQYRR